MYMVNIPRISIYQIIYCIHGFTFQWACLPLIDNYPGDQVQYEIHVYTGMKNKSGTQSRIYIHIYGTEGRTGIRALNDGARHVGTCIF